MEVIGDTLLLRMCLYRAEDKEEHMDRSYFRKVYLYGIIKKNVRMNKLTISGFGPIKEVELEMKDICTLIRPQASGKSTIAKLLYFFLFIKEDLMQFAAEAMTANVSKNVPSFNLIDIGKR